MNWLECIRMTTGVFLVLFEVLFLTDRFYYFLNDWRYMRVQTKIISTIIVMLNNIVLIIAVYLIVHGLLLIKGGG